ncbi:hypothetical protein, partial [Bradyrhizobium liaoningense]|uniref:hypothetical protein n=1 Tax=Bradyrhizobium liaoningense TaxID=43992 RepID=UPI001BA9425E
GSGRLVTRLDTPPSSHRHHPDSAIAREGLAGAIAAQERTNAADTVGQGCMAEKGYLLVKEDEADAKRAELARLLN